MSNPGFWNDTEKSASTVKKLKSLKATVEPWLAAASRYKELK
jgi:hypothetical protein